MVTTNAIDKDTLNGLSTTSTTKAPTIERETLIGFTKDRLKLLISSIINDDTRVHLYTMGNKPKLIDTVVKLLKDQQSNLKLQLKQQLEQLKQEQQLQQQQLQQQFQPKQQEQQHRQQLQQSLQNQQLKQQQQLQQNQLQLQIKLKHFNKNHLVLKIIFKKKKENYLKKIVLL